MCCAVDDVAFVECGLGRTSVDEPSTASISKCNFFPISKNMKKFFRITIKMKVG